MKKSKEKSKTSVCSPVYGTLPYKAEVFRQKFWYWMMTKHPKVYEFFEDHTKLDVLPF